MNEKPELIKYGIQNEKSDFRIHVCFVEGAVYIYETKCGLHAMKRGIYKKVPAYQDGVPYPTADGYIIPPDDIIGCIRLEIPHDLLQAADCQRRDSTSEKGRKTEKVFNRMRVRGLIPMLRAIEIDDTKMQVDGIDYVQKDDPKIQLKCDFTGGRKPKGTGYLYLQIAELNPKNMH